MPSEPLPERVTSTTYVAVRTNEVSFATTLREVIERVALDEPRLAAPLRIVLVRRLSTPEIARLHLVPASSTWLEVQLEVMRGASTTGRSTPA